MNKRVFIVGERTHSAYHGMFKTRGWEVVNNVQDSDLVQFTGGEDVSPSLYKETPHPKTFFNPIRDKVEALTFHAAVYMNKPMAGICRGGQFLNVMCGGTMWQHVNNHTGVAHDVIDLFSGDVFRATSTHHQMMKPSKDAIIIGVAQESTSKETVGERGHPLKITYNKPGDDYEVLYYEQQNCLCFQPHPEVYGMPELTDKYFHYVNEYLFRTGE